MTKDDGPAPEGRRPMTYPDPSILSHPIGSDPQIHRLSRIVARARENQIVPKPEGLNERKPQ